jgi:hypothetical protein
VKGLGSVSGNNTFRESAGHCVSIAAPGSYGAGSIPLQLHWEALGKTYQS